MKFDKLLCKFSFAPDWSGVAHTLCKSQIRFYLFSEYINNF